MVHRTGPLVFNCVESADTRLIALTELDTHMIAALLADETANCNVSATARGSSIRNSRMDTLVRIDVRLWKEVCDFFPVEGVNYQTVRMNKNCRLLIAVWIRRALRSKEKRFMFNQKLLSKMYSSDTREAVVLYLNHSRFFQDSMKHSSGHHSIVRSLKGAKVEAVYGQQHKVDTFDYGDGIPVLNAWDESTWDGTWIFSGKVCDVDIPCDWFHEYEYRYSFGCRKLYPKQWTFEPLLKDSVSKCRIELATYAQCKDIAMKSIAWKQRLATWYERRTGIPPAKKTRHLSLDEIVWLYFEDWNDLQDDPLWYLKRIDGRCYYPLVNQPRGLRRTNLRLFHNGEWQQCAEVDMSSAYYVFLASWLDPSECRDQLIDDLVGGNFYERLNEESGGEFSANDRDLLKVATQIECVFGKLGGRSGFGKGKRFLAMSRLYPDLSRFIMHKRRNHDVKWLSRKLTNAEGSLFIDCLLQHIVNSGIPCLPIHDGLVVPESAAEQVRIWCCELAKKRLGFEPNFKVSY